MSWRFLFGLMMVILAISFLLEYAHIISMITLFVILGWEWPAFIMLIGINQLIVNPAKPWSALTIIGASLIVLVRATLLIRNDSPDLGPLEHKLIIVTAILAVLIGIRIMLPSEEKRERSAKDTNYGSSKGTATPVRFEHELHDRVVLSGMFFKNESQKFHGGNIIAIIGDYEMDLRGAMLDNAGATLQIMVIFGSVRLRVPEHMLIKTEGKPLFASIENNTKQIVQYEAGRPELRVCASAIMSSVEFTN